MIALNNATPAALALYRALLDAVIPIGPFREDVKKTSVDLVRGTAFASIHFRREYLTVRIKSPAGIEEVAITNAATLDSELVGWLRAAYELCGVRLR